MSNQQYTKKQHFVPEFLLKNFIDSSGNLIDYNCKYKSFSSKTPAQICYLNNLYESHLSSNENDKIIISQNYLEEQFRDNEKIYSECISSIINECKDGLISPIPFEDKTRIDILTQFTANLLLRNPEIMKLARFDDDMGGWNTVETIMYTDYLKRVNNGVDNNISADIKKKSWLDVDDPNGAHSVLVRSIKKRMNMVLFYSTEENYITSDFPVVFSLNGLLPVVFFIPISTRLLLFYLNNENEGIFHNHIIAVNKIIVDSINKTIYKLSLKRSGHVYCIDKSDIESIINIGE